ncbi:DUF6338 family protein [Quadrisphaera sp. DSM 44207]|uniref:DUF6338 family protein n=1 Tax=Quadrisphaera sp. DSM 44207 TaxID=1881057 RepID=UPI0008815D47|nr:DUF6338 family protein [Quadrisphaera sp. DSM 44207]SDQ37943.1 hypothetical protein SAMN05428996_1472 [Quadrisphaera sp. DSM 44207]
MVPGSGLALLALLALVPGWLFLQLRRRHAPLQQSAGLGQLLEVLAVGLATTGIAGVVLAFLPHRWVPFLVDLQAWADLGGSYATANPRRILATATVLLVLASLLAWTGDRVFRRQRTELYLGPGAWVHALRERPKGTVPYLGLALQDGTLVEGLMHSCSLEASETRDVALMAPIRVTPPTATEANTVDMQRLVVPEREIRYITVLHLPEASPAGR